MVDVEAVRGEDDAGGVPPWLRLAGDDDRVRGFVRREAVRSTERGGVGERGVAREQLVLDTEGRECGLERGAIVVGHAVTYTTLRATGTMPPSAPPRAHPGPPDGVLAPAYVRPAFRFLHVASFVTLTPVPPPAAS